MVNDQTTLTTANELAQDWLRYKRLWQMSLTDFGKVLVLDFDEEAGSEVTRLIVRGSWALTFPTQSKALNALPEKISKELGLGSHEASLAKKAEAILRLYLIIGNSIEGVQISESGTLKIDLEGGTSLEALATDSMHEEEDAWTLSGLKDYLLPDEHKAISKLSASAPDGMLWVMPSGNDFVTIVFESPLDKLSFDTKQLLKDVNDYQKQLVVYRRLISNHGCREQVKFVESTQNQANQLVEVANNQISKLDEQLKNPGEEPVEAIVAESDTYSALLRLLNSAQQELIQIHFEMRIFALKEQLAECLDEEANNLYHKSKIELDRAVRDGDELRKQYAESAMALCKKKLGN